MNLDLRLGLFNDFQALRRSVHKHLFYKPLERNLMSGICIELSNIKFNGIMVDNTVCNCRLSTGVRSM